MLFLSFQNKILNKELEQCHDNLSKSSKAEVEANKKTEELKNQLQKAEWDISDISSLKNARILELEAQVLKPFSSVFFSPEARYHLVSNNIYFVVDCFHPNLKATRLPWNFFVQ